MRFTPSLLPAAMLLCLLAAPLKADPREAQAIAIRMANSYAAKGFFMAPTDHSGVLAGGQCVRFLVPVTKGLEYVFLAGGDTAAADLDVYVYDEVGNLILDDCRPSRYAGVQIRASYNGSAVVYLHMAIADGQGSYSMLVGRRGASKDGGTEPAPASPKEKQQ